MIITAYKCTRANGRDFRTGTVQYGVGKVVEQLDCAPASEGSCAKGLHVSPTPFLTCLFGDKGIDRGRWRWFEVQVAECDVIAQDHQKMRVSKLLVVKEITKKALFGDLKSKSARVRKIAGTYKKIAWLKPKREVTDAEVIALIGQWRERLKPWAKVAIPEGARIVRTAAAADAAAAAADDAADAAAAAAAADDAAADAAAAAAAADADAADADAAAAAAADDAAADAAAAAAADAAAAAAADDAGRLRNWIWYGWWCARPRWVLRRFAWTEFTRKPRQANPWEPLVRLYRMGCLPLGFCEGKTGPEFVVYVPPVRQ
jgi:hypothetical protein